MTKQNKLDFYYFYKILLTISILVSGACLIWGCLHIYFLEDGYSRQIVIDTFSKICVPVYISLVLIIAGFIIGIIKDSNKKTKFYKPKNFSQNKTPKLSAKKLFFIKITIIVVAIGILIFGALSGGFNDVLTKAVNICTECIGLG